MSDNSHIVFVPGFLCDERLFAFQVKAFSANYKTTVVDIKSPLNFESLVEEIGKVSTPRFHLVGFSMGGYLAKYFAAKFPERILSLSLVAANVGELSEKERKSRLAMTDVLKHAQYKGISEKQMNRFVHPQSLQNKGVVETIIAMSAGYNSEMYIRQTLATLHREDLSSAINALQFPVLVVAAKEDRVVRLDMLQSFHKTIARSEFKEIENCGHYIPLEKPEELTAALQSFIQ